MLTPQGQAYFHRQLIVLGYDDFAADFWFNLPNPQLSGRKPRECTAHEIQGLLEHMTHAREELAG
jgi:hypothetical protein